MKTELPITKMLEEENKSINTSPRVIAFLIDMIPRIRTIETQQLAQAKENAEKKVMEVLEEMIQEQIMLPLTNTTILSGKVLKEAIERFQKKSQEGNTCDNQ